MTDSYKDGFDAGCKGIDWKSNPHPMLSLKNLAWANGHLAGIDEAAWQRHVARKAAIPRSTIAKVAAQAKGE